MGFHEFFSNLYFYFDQAVIPLYRITGVAMADYLIGTFLLAFLCVLVGEASISVALRLNRSYVDALTREMEHKERLSIEAYRLGDQGSYQALNKEATDAWGKQFFIMVAYSAGVLWPIPFALGWMQTRFQDVAFPLAFPLSLLFGKTVGYTFSFIPIYILCRLLFKYLRPRLPYFRGIQKILDEYGAGKAK